MTDWNDGAMRINKFLSAMGYCSRREADRLIEEGKVKVDGVRAELGTLVEPGMKVTVKEELVGTWIIRPGSILSGGWTRIRKDSCS